MGTAVGLTDAHGLWGRQVGALADVKAYVDAVAVGAGKLGIWERGGFVPLQPFVVSRQAVAELHHVGMGLQELLIRHALDQADNDLSRLADAAELTEGERWFLPSGRPLPQALGCRRSDVFVEGGSPRFLELNFGTCLNGATAAPVLARTFLGSAVGRNMREWHDLTADSVFAARLAWLRDLEPDAAPVALLGFAGAGDEGSSRAFDEETTYFAAHGVACDFVPVEEAEVDGGALVWRGKRYGAAIRYFMVGPAVLAEHSDLMVALERASGTALFGAYVSQLFTSKNLLADLYADPRLTAAERALLDHVPWLARLRPGAVRRGDHAVDPLDWAERNRERCVLKPANLHGSRGVVLGPSTSDSEWRGALAAAVAEGGYVVQELVVPDLWTTSYWDTSAEAVVEVSAPVLLGPFVAGGRPGGCFTQQPITGAPEDLVRSGAPRSFGVLVA